METDPISDAERRLRKVAKALQQIADLERSPAQLEQNQLAEVARRRELEAERDSLADAVRRLLRAAAPELRLKHGACAP